MKVADFELYKDLLLEQSGLVLTPDKSYLLDSRLTPVAKKWNFVSIEIMTLQLRALPDDDLISDIVEAMTTTETSFFRDTKPYIEFEQFILPQLIKQRKGKKHLRIWCAASASGQEPYSLAMILKDNEALLKGWKIEILATDLSANVLEQAKRGIYTQFEVQRGVPIAYLVKFFEQINEKWRLRDEIRGMVAFRSFNLLEDMDRLGPFDLIFCRNVLGYFDAATCGRVLGNAADRLDPEGFMVLGKTENPVGLTDKIAPIPGKSCIFAKPGQHGAQIPSAASKRA